MTVYFIKPVGSVGPIKVGSSSSPETRRQQMEGWSPVQLEIVATIDGDKHIEARFHAAFAAAHYHHEWFHATPEVLAIVESVKAGTCEVEALPLSHGTAQFLTMRLAKYAPIDWEYFRLYERYNTLPGHLRMGRFSPITTEAFHKRSPSSKSRHLVALEEWLERVAA